MAEAKEILSFLKKRNPYKHGIEFHSMQPDYIGLKMKKMERISINLATEEQQILEKEEIFFQSKTPAERSSFEID